MTTPAHHRHGSTCIHISSGAAHSCDGSAAQPSANSVWHHSACCHVHASTDLVQVLLRDASALVAQPDRQVVAARADARLARQPQDRVTRQGRPGQAGCPGREGAVSCRRACAGWWAQQAAAHQDRLQPPAARGVGGCPVALHDWRVAPRRGRSHAAAAARRQAGHPTCSIRATRRGASRQAGRQAGTLTCPHSVFKQLVRHVVQVGGQVGQPGRQVARQHQLGRAAIHLAAHLRGAGSSTASGSSSRRARGRGRAQGARAHHAGAARARGLSRQAATCVARWPANARASPTSSAVAMLPM